MVSHRACLHCAYGLYPVTHVEAYRGLCCSALCCVSVAITTWTHEL